MGKYDPLREYLRHQHGEVAMSFDQVADLVGGLPDSAYNYQVCWGHHPTHVQSSAWCDVGLAAHANIHRRNVTFERN